MTKAQRVLSKMIAAMKRKEARKARQTLAEGAFGAYQVANLAKLDQKLVLMVK
jgi:hypothetical protein